MNGSTYPKVWKDPEVRGITIFTSDHRELMKLTNKNVEIIGGEVWV